MSDYVDGFVHDLFPDVRDFQAFAFRERPILNILNQSKHEGKGKSWGYPVLVQAAIAQGTTRAAVQRQQDQAGNADIDVEEFTLGYFKPGYKGGFILDDFNLALTQADGGVPSGAYLHDLSLKVQESASEFGQRQELYFVGLKTSLAFSTANGGTTDLANGVFRCADRFQIANIRKGQLVQFSLNDGSDDAHAIIDIASSDGVYVTTSVDFDTGTVGIAAVAGGPSLSTLDTAAGANQVHIFNNSDFQGSATVAANKLPPGFQDWIPSSSPTDTFAGVVRNNNDSRLGGFRVAVAPGMQLDAVIKKGLREARGLHGATGTYKVMVGSERWSQLMELAEARGYRVLDGEGAVGGYKYISYKHGTMCAEIIDVPSMSSNDMFFAKMEHWTVRHLSGWPRPFGHDGLKSLRKATDDSFEYRTASYYHFGCSGVNMQGRADISTISL